MPNTVDVTCKIIPLYRVRIMIEDEKRCRYEYERHIVSDSIQGLIEGIVDAELLENKNFEDEEVRMTFDIQDFLLMPCVGARTRGYHLFDIDTVDCATFAASVDQEIWYDLHLVGDKNVTGDLRDADNAVYAEPLPVSDVDPQPREYASSDSIMKEIEDRDATMNALYHLAQASKYREDRLAKEAQYDAEHEAKAKKHLLETMAEEATRTSGREGLNA